MLLILIPTHGGVVDRPTDPSDALLPVKRGPVIVHHACIFRTYAYPYHQPHGQDRDALIEVSLARNTVTV